MTRDRAQTRSATLRKLGAIALFSATLGLTYACSLIVEDRSQQCQSDADCTQFGAAFCDLTQNVCVTKSDGGQSSGAGGGACATPANNTQILNACTDSACIAFDNQARCTNLTADGGRPPIP